MSSKRTRRDGSRRAARPRGPADARFKHVLVPIDLSDKNARALRTARALATGSGARVTVLHVVQRVPNISVQEMRPFYQRLLATSRKKLAETAASLAAAGLSVRSEVLIGDPARQIVRVAMTKKADLVVMGSHKVDPTRKTRGWGTTSYKVGIFCQCPILLVK